MIINKKYYINNINYTHFLEKQNINDFRKYIDKVKVILPLGGKFLDVGCGIGSALKLLDTKKYYLYGLEISKTSIDRCIKKGLKCSVYDGDKIPFSSNYFNVVGSFNVLEHVDKPIDFLNEKLRVLKDEGFLIIVCPNFLSITNNYHRLTKGLMQKIKNIYLITKKIFTSNPYFIKIESNNMDDMIVINDDDDVINITNPIDILKWAKLKRLDLIYWSSRPIYKSKIINLFDFGFLKYILGSCFFIFRKDNSISKYNVKN